jgi:hypothetical protein
MILLAATALALTQPDSGPAGTPASAPSTDQGASAPAGPPSDGTASPPVDAASSSDAAPAPEKHKSGTDIFSRDTISVLLDARLVAANGERSFSDGGFGKTRFGGTNSGDYRVRALPLEADLLWMPHFTGSLSANVSAAWQRGQENGFDLIEAFVNFLPPQTGKTGIQLRAGLMWPEISLEHSTGGAWSVVNTITPSAINSWVGEEVKVIGLEGTVRTSIGNHQFGFTAGVFGFNDTSGTLLSFRGWALQDEKATGFGHFPLPPLNPFITLLQQNETRSTIEIDNRPGFYGRIEWRPPAPMTLSAFYYDNRGDPQAFTPRGQWGWRTRFLNVGLNATLGPNTTLLAQGMVGSTIMGFQENGIPWVHTFFRSIYGLVTQRLTDKWAVTGRLEFFGTREHGSEMSPLNSEDGWATTAAVRYNMTNNLTVFVEALNVRSTRGTRVDVGLNPFQAQTVFQTSVRFRI